MTKPDGLPAAFDGRQFRHAWAYRDTNGETLGYVARFEDAEGKSVVPFFMINGTGWKPKGAPEPRPLYNLNGLADAPPDAEVFVVEGEKAAAALEGLGLATTSPGGANGAHAADWKPLTRFRKVYILPDADAPGESYAAAVAAELAALPGSREVLICRLPGLAEHGDCVDFLQSRVHGWNGYDAVPREPGDDLANELLEAVRDCAEPVTASATATEAATAEWPEPIALDAADVPAWPAVFPERVQEFVDALAASTETPIELASMAALATLAASVHGKHLIEVGPGYTEPLALWTCTALPPGSRKSTVFGKAACPLIQYEKAERERVAPDIDAAESQAKTATARIATMRRKAANCEDAEARAALTEQIADADAAIPIPPKAPRLFTADVTPERLAALMAENSGAMAILADESGFLDTFAGRYANGVANLDVLLQGHSGTTLRVDRAGRDPVFINNPALSIGIAPQPEILKGMDARKTFRGRGLLARFLFAIPESTVGKRTFRAPEIPYDVMGMYNSVVTALLKRPFHDEPHVLTLDPEGYELWRSFALWLEPQQQEGETFGHLRDWAGKLPGAVARIAGVLHLAENAFANAAALPVSAETMRRAAELGRVLAAHALIAFDVMGADPALDDARAILSWIVRNGEPTFTKRDTHAANQRRLPRADDAEAALDILVERHFIRPQPQPVNPRGGRPSTVFEVNPAILGGKP